ncbi:MAG: hypothetical protein AB1422_05285 [bacterium]
MSYNCNMIVFDSSTIILLAKIEILDAFLLNFQDRTLVTPKVTIQHNYSICAVRRETSPH